MESLVTGAVFGAALTSSGVYQPSVIVSQLAFTNWHMIQVFLTAAATSIIVVAAVQSSGLAKFGPRAPSSLGLFGRYDGNIIGGALLGAGMALSGACPGTVLVQVGLGVPSGIFALLGGLTASVLWSRYLGGPLDPGTAAAGCSSPTTANASSSAPETTQDKTLTIHDLVGLDRTTVAATLVAAFAAVVAATSLLTTLGPEARVPTLVGGLTVGLVQLLSVLSRGALLGVSGAYEELGARVLPLVQATDIGAKLLGSTKPARSHSNNNEALFFAAGILAGARLLAHLAPHLIEPTHLAISPLSALLGGALVIFGSTLASGCTSGHGISGVSLLSTASFVTLMAIFAGGAAVALPGR